MLPDLLSLFQGLALPPRALIHWVRVSLKALGGGGGDCWPEGSTIPSARPKGGYSKLENDMCEPSTETCQDCWSAFTAKAKMSSVSEGGRVT